MSRNDGLFAATYTPFTSDDQLNIPVISPFTEHLIATGVNGLFVCGSTGEGMSLTVEERCQTAAAFIAAAAGRIPTIVHVGHNCLSDAATLSRHAAEQGATAVAACSPSYHRPATLADLVDASKRADAIDAVLSRVEKAITSGKNTVVYTSRTLVTGDTPSKSLAIGNAVSDGLVTIVSKLQSQPRFIIAKGGITSSDVATKGLGIKRAMVLGQAAPGVPVWSIGEEGKFPGMSYVVFPGNVGGDDELAKLVRRLSE